MYKLMQLKISLLSCHTWIQQGIDETEKENQFVARYVVFAIKPRELNYEKEDQLENYI